MSLNWDYTACADFEAIEPVLRQTAPFMCMTVGIGHVTNDNVKEFYLRVNLMEKATGAFRNESDGTSMKPMLMTPDEARSLVGMRCNITPMTKTKFKTHMFDIHERMTKF